MLHKEGFYLEAFYTLLAIFSDRCVVWPWFFYCCKELLLDNLLDTYKLIIGYVENFLEALKVKFPWKNEGVWQDLTALKMTPEQLFLRFVFNVSCDIFRLMSRMIIIFYCCKKLILNNLLNCYMLIIGRVKKILAAFKVQFSWKNLGVDNIRQHWKWLQTNIFKKT